MRIAMLVGRLTLGGAELAMLDLARGLARAGHDVHLLTLFDHADAPALLADAPDVHYRALAGRQGNGGPAVAAQLFAVTIRLRVLLLRERIDVVYSALNIANAIASIAAPPPTRVLWSFHAAGLTGSWEDRAALAVCRVFARRAAAVAVSEPARGFVRAQGVRPALFEVIGNGTDTDAIRPDASARARGRALWSLDGERFVVGVVARVARVKAPERWLAAIAALRDALRAAGDPREVTGIWIGGGAQDYLSELRAHAEQRGIAGCVRFVGPSRALCEAYNAFDAFLLLSHSEGYAKVVAEAMAAGRPCVVDRRAGAETLGEAGVVVDGDDAAAVAQALATIARDPAAASTFGAAARARCVAELSLASALTKTEALLARIVDGARA